MAYYLGRDVKVAITTEDADYGVDVSGVTKGTFTDSAGSTDTVFAGNAAVVFTGVTVTTI